MLNTKQVLELATKLHLPHKRDNGDPYITHPIRVAKLVTEALASTGQTNEQLIQAAYLHDILEDCEELTSKDLLMAGVDPTVVYICNGLNKNKYDSYTEYIRTIALVYELSIVKYADLEDNLSDKTNAPEYYLTKHWKQRKDKYELAQYILHKAQPIVDFIRFRDS